MSLKTNVLQSSTYLVLRENINLLTRTFGLLVLTRFLSPEIFGLYAASQGIVSFFNSIAQMGLNVYITRYKGENIRKLADTLFTFILFISVFFMIAGAILAPFLKSFTKLEGFSGVTIILFASLPLSLINLVPLGLIERSMLFKQISFIEMISQFIYYIISIPLAVINWNVWAPVIGYMGMSIFSCIATFILVKYRPRFTFDNKLLFSFIKFGIGYSSSSMAWQLRSLINPLIIAPLAGAEALGTIALATRIAESLNLFREATRRVSISALSKVQDNIALFKKTISTGVSYQVIALGPVLAGFVVLSPFFISFLLGEKWIRINDIFPYIAFNVLCNAFGTVQTSALHVMNKNYSVSICHFFQNSIIAFSAWILIQHFGISGYGYSLLICLPAFLFLLLFLQRAIGSIDYKNAIIWFCAFSVALFSTKISLLLLFALTVPFIIHKTRSQFLELFILIIPWKDIKWIQQLRIANQR